MDRPIPEAVREARQIIDEFIQCAAVGRPHGNLIAQARDWLALTAAQQQDQPMQQGGGDDLVEAEGEVYARKDVEPEILHEFRPFTAPPSAPVGVEEVKQRAGEVLAALTPIGIN